ncbi:exodeoxyribonuclease V subunit beta [Segetibacter sp. 3557_3]|uniref:exodeoxyribonuclease V subunit beta n=1 Tax=Segetibacter sp. 3557_3 TaxID=2547429 RepID=UPI001058425A|nr:exodeoxyribonuclease V subunit beta [Segetibacter sp. 3557_3]TDH24173.1 exodeoxyribonuclease V subunit beta [Segetibacter sp. 3557_3]
MSKILSLFPDEEQSTTNSHQEFKPFDAGSVDLVGSNLIEASAGTGKTYSIAILVLRLIIEQKLSVKEILMVTFTKAAVAELEERIRLFIRKAYKASQGEQIDDGTISGLVSAGIAKTSATEVQEQLKEAVLFLDETAVLTIHSFCQLTLTEFAFETNQLFGAETMQDTGIVLQDEVNKFWRENITTIPARLLQYLVTAEPALTREHIRQVVQEHLNGKQYFNYDKNKDYAYCEEDHQKILTELAEIEIEEQKLKGELHEFIKNNEQEIRDKSLANTHARKARFHEFESPEQLVTDILAKRKSGYIQTVFADIVTRCNDCDILVKDISSRIQQVINDISCQAINIVSAGLEDYKQRNNLLSFDDMIVNLHRAFTGKNPQKLVDALQNKYKAVFVDEFQDTDRLQYEIFQKAFGSGTILFLIGDPKQSIYAWRKADIFTYFKAKNDVQNRYTMNRNFRSAEGLIHAMNLFFEPRPGFDTFFFNDSEDAIRYREVHSPEPNMKGELGYQRQAVVPITITTVPRKEQLSETVAAQIIQLLSDDGFRITRNGEHRRVTPSDIGILVRTKGQGREIKQTLARYCIPAITIDDSKVLRSPEAICLLYVLEAMTDISRQSINRALLSPFTGYKAAEILSLNDEITLTLFRKYRNQWQNDGVFTALMEFVSDFDVRGVLLGANTESGERIIANLFQLIEVVHKVQTNKQFSPPELISWLRRGIEGMEAEGDEYEQRVESDEESVKIVTIHKSKGLEYNIVFAPFLDLVENTFADMFSYRDPESGEYISIEKNKIGEEQLEWVRMQNEQENRRLVYVSLTRAVYKCFVHHCSGNYYRNSTLSTFLQALNGCDERLISNEEAAEPPKEFRYQEDDRYKPVKRNTEVKFTLEHNNWTKMSYSMLAQKGEITSKPRSTNQGDKYDQFMFSQLVRGSKTGNLLHYIFEHVQFSSEYNWSYVIEEALNQHLPKHKEQYSPMLYQMLQHTLNVPLQIGEETFKLAEIDNDERINEFEFDFPVPVYDPAMLNKLTDNNIEVRVSWDKPLEGIVNGKVDLFFGVRDKYYILDWKSNYLGDSLADYAPRALATAMNENNYHLQYLLYTLAATKYLKSRLPDFRYEKHFGGVIYLFIRGIRKNGQTGIFVNRPSPDQLEALERIMNAKD